jgi:hypothetical protein
VACAGISHKVGQRRAAGARTTDYLLLLAKGTLWRALPHVLMQRMRPARARALCSVFFRPHLVFHLPQLRRDYLSVNDGPPLGSLCSSGREIARTTWMASGWHRAAQATRDAQEDLSTHFRDARLSRGYPKTGRELRAKIQARSAPRSSVAAVSKQVCRAWWMASPL